MRWMKDYLKHSLRENPNHFILHVVTNDLNSKRSPELIDKSIADLAASLKNENHDVSISNIIVRTEKKHLLLKKNIQKFVGKEVCIWVIIQKR